MTNYNFEPVTVAAGAYIGWHDQPGQVVTGKVIDYQQAGGQDFNGGACPLLVLELVEPASSFSKDGTRTDFNAGDMVTITAGQANLRRNVLAAQPSAGDVIRITRTANAKTANGTAKLFEIQIARGAGGPASAPAPQSMNPATPAPFPAPQGSPNPAPAPNPFAQQAATPPF